MMISIKPIGRIVTSNKTIENSPIQPQSAIDSTGYIEIHEEFEPALKDLKGFSHIILIYWFHKVRRESLQTIPFLDNKIRGVFSTRSPQRPNHLGLSVVPLLSIEHNIVHFSHADMLDDTPLIDIKPFVPDFDVYFDVKSEVKTGWLSINKQQIIDTRSDDRFK